MESVRSYLTKGEQVLDVGAGKGFLAEGLHESLGVAVTGIDVVNYAGATVPFVVYDGKTFPFPKKKLRYRVALVRPSSLHRPGPNAARVDPLRTEAGHRDRGHLYISVGASVYYVERLSEQHFPEIHKSSERLGESGVVENADAAHLSQSKRLGPLFLPVPA